MTETTKSPIFRLDDNGRRSGVVSYGGFVFLTGQGADDASLDIAGQTQQALAKIDRLLASVGTHKGRLLTAQIWIRSMRDFDGMNAVWDAWLEPGNRPTRCCGEVGLANPNWLVEIVVSAAA